MRDLNKGEERFYRDWEAQRKKKWRYIILHGTVYWGMPVALGLFLLMSHFRTNEMQLKPLIISVLLFGTGGLFFGLNQFNNMEKRYSSLNDDFEIARGIEDLNTGGLWNYENLKISLKEDGVLVIQNELYWFDEKGPSPDKLNQCYDLVFEDFQRLQKNKAFYEYSKNKKVRIEISGNSESNKPLLEMVI
jgi:hypothetical protein